MSTAYAAMFTMIKLCLVFFALNGVHTADIKIGVILPLSTNDLWILPKTRPAIEIAIETVQHRTTLLKGYNIKATYADSQCDDTHGPLRAIDMYVRKSAHVFLGPACDYAVAPIARFAYYWNIPVITAGALVSAFADKSEYKLLTRIMGTYAKIGHFVEDTFQVFNWSTVGLLYTNSKGPNDGRSNCYFAVEPLFIAMLNKSSKEPWYTSFDEESPDVDYAKHLKEASLHTRVIILCASPSSIREIMIKAHELNFDNGEYVFFNIDLFSSKNASERPWYKADDTPERNSAARKAYEALMTVTLRKPTSPEYRKFSEEVKRRASKMYANFTYGEEEVNSFVGAFHDAVILYAIALNETLEANGSVSDGKAITDRMWNRTFRGITGTVSIDANGDRNADYSLLDLNPKTDKFEVVANYYGNRKRYEPVTGKRIHWAGNRGGPPKDTPVCGFDGSKCPPEGVLEHLGKTSQKKKSRWIMCYIPGKD